MKRQVVLDTETTGFDAEKDDRIVEIGAVEIVNFLPTGKNFHCFINPERTIPEDVVRVHGITNEKVADSPVFAQIVEEFLEFVGDSELVIHNAEFDMRFINAEMKKIGMPIIPIKRAIDTLAIARDKFPGSPASLDALCRRFNIDNSSRSLHGALLDAQLLAEVYLELIGGRQQGFVLEEEEKTTDIQVDITNLERKKRELRNIKISDEEKAEHIKFIQQIKNSLWLKKDTA